MTPAQLKAKLQAKLQIPTPKEFSPEQIGILSFQHERKNGAPVFFDFSIEQDSIWIPIPLQKIVQKEADSLAPIPSPISENPFAPEKPIKHESFALSVQLDEYQQTAVEFAQSGKCFCIIGPAGSGKTTTQREVARSLWKQGKLKTHNFKSGDGPSIAFCAFTNVATGNLKRAIHKDPELRDTFQNCVLTIHMLLEFMPIFYEIEDSENPGQTKTTMRFEPQRNASNPLRLTHLVIEEGTQVDLFLWQKLFDALLPETQIIFIGDINQLPPVFGPSVFNYAITSLPVVELKNIYRQEENSNILEVAHQVLRGEKNITPDGKQVVLIQTPPGGKLIQASTAASRFITGLRSQFIKGTYNPETDIVLSPFNKNELGTVTLNSMIATFLDHKKKETNPKFKVWEIIAGMNKHYLAVGDKVFVQKLDGIITSINFNTSYFGKTAKPAMRNLSRFGMYIPDGDHHFELEGEFDDSPDYANLNVEEIPDDERKNKASHIVTVLLETGEEVVLETAGDFGIQNFQLGYCLTVHKAQGREWRKIYIVLHRSHAVLLFRELIYTAITRAREEVVILDWTNHVQKAIENPRIIGNSLEEKIASFNAKVALNVPIALIP